MLLSQNQTGWNVYFAYGAPQMSQCHRVPQRLALQPAKRDLHLRAKEAELPAREPQWIFQIEFHNNLFNGDVCGRCILEITLASTSPNETHFRQPCGNLCHSCPTNGQPSSSKPSGELCGNLPRLPGKRRKMGPGLNICLDMSQSLDHVCF